MGWDQSWLNRASSAWVRGESSNPAWRSRCTGSGATSGSGSSRTMGADANRHGARSARTARPLACWHRDGALAAGRADSYRTWQPPHGHGLSCGEPPTALRAFALITRSIPDAALGGGIGPLPPRERPGCDCQDFRHCGQDIWLFHGQMGTPHDHDAGIAGQQEVISTAGRARAEQARAPSAHRRSTSKRPAFCNIARSATSFPWMSGGICSGANCGVS